ncbi:unnamed protein product [Fraxinus pennsylvanica]|uniref:phosphoserine transaminase n=1 Tax=Fraxinus pennsylvanica TaxID=56036 RepID=A0AAD2EB00_9LAMI|nr:unnamed protein product [Fraxinus pennsylvanica]
MCGLVFEDLIVHGGLNEVEKKNVKKVQILYDTIDGSKGFFRYPVKKSVRSLMNVPFTLVKLELEAELLKEVAKEKMMPLKGHKSGGSMRALIYNAMPLAGSETVTWSRPASDDPMKAKETICFCRQGPHLLSHYLQAGISF